MLLQISNPGTLILLCYVTAYVTHYEYLQVGSNLYELVRERAKQISASRRKLSTYPFRLILFCNYPLAPPWTPAFLATQRVLSGAYLGCRLCVNSSAVDNLQLLLRW